MPPLAWKRGPVAAPTAAGSTGPPPTFRHAGRNAYAWLLDELGIDTFAFVAIQLYEGWSRASHAIATTTAAAATGNPSNAANAAVNAAAATAATTTATASTTDDNTAVTGGNGTAATAHLVSWATRAMRGWDVFLDGAGAPPTRISVPADRLVVGLANGWADGDKFLRVGAGDIGRAFAELRRRQIEAAAAAAAVVAAKKELGEEEEEEVVGSVGVPLGVMFWTIEEEGADGLFFAPALRSALGSALGTRIDTTPSNEGLATAVGGTWRAREEL